MRYGINGFTSNGWLQTEIEEKFFENILTARSNLYELQYIEEKFDLVIENYLEFEDTFSQITLRTMLLPDLSSKNITQERGQLNRRLLNLLTSIRSYIDHSKRHFLKLNNGNQDELERLIDIFNKQYDEMLEYRTMEAVRNFAQHRDLPAHSISHRWSHKEEKGENRQLTEVNIFMRVKELKKDKRIKEKLISELEEIGEDINLRLFSRGYLEGIWNVHKWIRNKYITKVKEWEEILESAHVYFNSKFQNISPTVITICEQDDLDQNIKEIVLRKDFSEYRNYLENKNRDFNNFRLRIFTSQ